MRISAKMGLVAGLRDVKYRKLQSNHGEISHGFRPNAGLLNGVGSNPVACGSTVVQHEIREFALLKIG